MPAALVVRHVPIRGATLARDLLVIGKVHTSDSQMNIVIASLVRDHTALGGNVMLMSRAMGWVARAQFQEAPLPDLATARAGLFRGVERTHGASGRGQR